MSNKPAPEANQPASAAAPQDSWAVKRKPLFGFIPRITPNWATNSKANVLGTVTHKPGEFLKGSFGSFRAVFGRKEVRKETFEQAVARMKLSEDDLLVRRGSLVVGSRFAYASAFLLVLVCGYFAYEAMLLQVAAAAAMFSFSVASGLVRAFRAWQIQIRRLASFSEFLQTSEAWLI